MNRSLVMTALLSSVFLSAIEGTAVSTAMPTIIGDLGGMHLYGWVFAAYMFASSVTVPLFGKLGDQYGRKLVYVGGLIVFVLGSTLCGFANSIELLIACRLIQGFGAGAMQPISLTIIGDMYGISERARIQAFFGTVWGIAGVLGPLVGSFFVEIFDWRWIFFVNLPFGIFALIIFLMNYQEIIEAKAHRIDWAGFVSLSMISVAIMLGAEGIYPMLMYPSAILLVFVFWRFESLAAEPILPLPLLRRRLIWVSAAICAGVGIQMYGSISFLPLYCQGVLASSPFEAGIVVTSIVFGWPLSAYLSGLFFARLGFRRFVISGSFAISLSMALIAFGADAKWPIYYFYVFSFLLGVGFGLLNTSIVVAIQTSVNWDERGVATASTLFFRTMAGTVAVAVLGVMLKLALTSDPSVPIEYGNLLLRRDPSILQDSEKLASISGVLWLGLVRVFWCCFAASLVNAALSLLFPRQLPQTSS